MVQILFFIINMFTNICYRTSLVAYDLLFRFISILKVDGKRGKDYYLT